MDILGLFFSPNGRIGRLTYCLCALAIVICSFIAATVFLPTMSRSSFANPASLNNSLLIASPFMIAHFMVGMKRAHDLGHTGIWLAGWMTAAYASPALFLFGFAMMLVNVVAGFAIVAVGVAAGFGATYQLGLKLCFFAGDERDNDFGPPASIGSSGAATANQRRQSGNIGFTQPRGRGGNWMDQALQSVEKEAVTRQAHPAGRAAAAGRANQAGAPAAFGRARP